MSVEKFREEMPAGLYEKVKVQTLTIFCFAVLMFFAGFISAYIVQSSDKVWVQVAFPEVFSYSTICVVLVSLFLILAKIFTKKQRSGAVSMIIIAAIVFGCAFCYFQVKGWNELVRGGNLVSVHVINPIGQYDSKFHFEKNGEKITHDGQRYFEGSELLSEEDVIQLKLFASDVCDGQHTFGPKRIVKLEENWSPFTIVSTKGRAVEFIDEVQYWQGGDTLNFSERQDLFNFSVAVDRNMEYFKLTGEYGKDFVILLNGEGLEYENKQFFYKNLVMNDEIKNNITDPFYLDGVGSCTLKNGLVVSESGDVVDVSEGVWNLTSKIGKVLFSIRIDEGVWTRQKSEISSDDYAAIKNRRNSTSSYIWVLTVAHFLHIIGGIIYLIALFKLALNKRIVERNQVKIRLANIYWHVLGGLWVFLFLFFQYYH